MANLVEYHEIIRSDDKSRIIVNQSFKECSSRYKRRVCLSGIIKIQYSDN